MGKASLVIDNIQDGAKLVEALERKGVKMTLAFWHSPPEEGRWMLFICSPMLEARGPRWLYERIVSALNRLDLSISLDEVALVSVNTAIVKRLLATTPKAKTPQGDNTPKYTPKYATGNDIVYASA